MPPDFTNLYIK